MQTFLPYSSFVRSARCLDSRRLGNQRNECTIILDALRTGNRWSRHPAVLMWAGYEPALELYQAAVVAAWCRQVRHNRIVPTIDWRPIETPWWLGREWFHASHRSNLLRKNQAFYSQYGWIEPNDLPYMWPTKVQDRFMETEEFVSVTSL